MEIELKEREKHFLDEYDVTQFKRPNVAIDTAIFTIKDNALYVLVIKRNDQPYFGCWSLVGGFIDIDKDKTIDETAKRKLLEKTGVHAPYLEQFKTVGNSSRDPRGWTVTTVYFALISSENIVSIPDDNIDSIKWAKIEKDKISDKLAFDHAEILQGCLDRLRTKVMYSSIPVYLLPNEFTLSELQKVHEIILGNAIDRKTFHRRILNSGILKETGRKKFTGRRPGKIYSLVEKEMAHYFSRTMG